MNLEIYVHHHYLLFQELVLFLWYGRPRLQCRLADPPSLGHRYGLTILRELDQITVSQCRVGGAVDTLVSLNRVAITLDRMGEVEQALPVMLGMAGYLATIFEGLTDAQMQTLLKAEYGGLNEAYAETYALTGNSRWLRIAEKIYDHRVLDPLAGEQDKLAGLHANTQIPKLIGLARIYELGGGEKDHVAARFFRDVVARHHSYVIGGNSEAEHFGPPDQLSKAITERTCEHCNSYNMLKLTRHQYGWAPDAALFDFYERIHLNHVLASQNPDSGMFAYFMPLSAGAKRTWSTPHDSFWCCVGSGLESHAKHGDSIYWHDDAALYVNLFIASALDWEGAKLSLSGDYPFSDTVTIEVNAPMDRALALRLPEWSNAPRIRVNGETVRFQKRGGYAWLARKWRAGDRVELVLPMALAVEPMADDPGIVAFTHGPVVLAGDLGPDTDPWESLPPALVGASPREAVAPVDAAAHHFRLNEAKPQAVELLPFFNRYDRRTAVYFPSFTPARWEQESAAFIADQRAQQALKKRTVDQIDIGEQQPERDHDFALNHADLQSWAGKSGRLLPWGRGNFIEFTLAVRPGPMVLRALYWGEEVNKDFVILGGGQAAMDVTTTNTRQGKFEARFYHKVFEEEIGRVRGHFGPLSKLLFLTNTFDTILSSSILIRTLRHCGSRPDRKGLRQRWRGRLRPRPSVRQGLLRLPALLLHGQWPHQGGVCRGADRHRQHASWRGLRGPGA